MVKLPVVSRPRGTDIVGELRRLGVRCLATVSGGGTPLPAVDRGRGPVALLVGSEAFGLSPTVRDAADARVSIPMAAGVDSFSVNAAAAVVLYELIGRRSAG